MSKEQWVEYKNRVLESIRDFSVVFKDIQKQTPSNDGWVSALCPFHSDTKPSFGFNRNTGAWVCFAGCGKGDVLAYLMHTTGNCFKDTLICLGNDLGIPKPEFKKNRPPIEEKLIKQWINYLWANEDVCRWLREKRGLSDQTLKRFEIGWDPKRQRNTIPIRDERGNVVNVRLYNGKKSPKIINYTEGKYKYGSPARLFGVNHLIKSKDKQVILCEGEWDRMLLEQEGFVAVSGTHGAGTFRPEWSSYFKNKDVVILYDCDQEGQQAATKIVIPALKNTKANSIKNVALPLRGDKTDKDVSDYFHVRGLTAENLQKRIDETSTHSYEKECQVEPVKILDSFVEIELNENIDKKVQCEITICGETSESFHAVEEFKILFCPKMQKGGCFECKGVVEKESIPRGSQEYIGSCMSSNNQLIGMLRDYACKYGQKPSLELLKRITVKEFFCHQKINRLVHERNDDGEIQQYIDGKRQELLEKRVYFLNSKHVKPGNYRATGWVKSHPKTQQVTFLIETLEPIEDDYESFRLEKSKGDLQAFQKLSWEEILQDLTDNVTRIYSRDEILVSCLLTYCSPRWIPFNGSIIRGWMVTVVIGDAGSGKSQTFQRIAEFVNIGDFFSGLTGSRTGLAYALKEHKQKGWQVTIGRFPANSRKILIIDESHFISNEDLRTISKGMEEGYFQIDRVQSKGYECQTRLILIANPRKDAVMDSFSFGCEAISTVFPSTIIRRTDIGIFANSGDLKDLSLINKRCVPTNHPKVTPEMLRSLIYWAWNLGSDQISFSSDAESRSLSLSEEMSKEFGHAFRIPLVTPSDFRNNLARIATAFAVLLVSTDESFSRLFVKVEHVEVAARFLRKVYTHENCSLDRYSKIEQMNSQLIDYDDIERCFLERREKEKHAPFQEEDDENDDEDSGRGTFSKIIFILYISSNIRREDLAEQAGCGTTSVKNVIRFLRRFNLIESSKDGYVKKPKFNKFLKLFERNYPDFFEGMYKTSGGRSLSD